MGVLFLGCRCDRKRVLTRKSSWALIALWGVSRDHSDAWIGGFMSENIKMHPLGMNCKNIMNEFDELQLQHVHRERNRVVDLLDKSSTSHMLMCTFIDPPTLVTEALLDDIVGNTRARCFNTNNAG
ncbi:hypothetical protein ACLB2K_067663 [Fragaria x ananassa]